MSVEHGDTLFILDRHGGVYDVFDLCGPMSLSLSRDWVNVRYGRRRVQYDGQPSHSVNWCSFICRHA